MLPHALDTPLPHKMKALVEKFAVMIGPMVSGGLLEVDGPVASKAEAQAQDDARDRAAVHALSAAMEPVLRRELDSANSLGAIQLVQNQIEDVRRIMEVCGDPPLPFKKSRRTPPLWRFTRFLGTVTW